MEGVLFSGNASMHLELGILSRWKEYVKILKENHKQSAPKLGLVPYFVFQHDNDPQHTPLLMKKYLQKMRVKIIDFPAQSPDLLICAVMSKVHARKPSNLEKLERFAKEEWLLKTTSCFPAKRKHK